MIVEQDENMQMELLTPLTANFMPETSYWNELDEDDEAWDYEYDGLPLDGTDLVQYKDAIQEMVDKENSFGSEDGKPCNLMQYFDGSPAIKEKVESAVVSVKEVNDVLYGCVTLQLKTTCNRMRCRNCVIISPDSIVTDGEKDLNSGIFL